jgi:hypothetical protein
MRHPFRYRKPQSNKRPLAHDREARRGIDHDPGWTTAWPSRLHTVYTQVVYCILSPGRSAAQGRHRRPHCTVYPFTLVTVHRDHRLQPPCTARCSPAAEADEDGHDDYIVLKSPRLLLPAQLAPVILSPGLHSRGRVFPNPPMGPRAADQPIQVCTYPSTYLPRYLGTLFST